MGTTRWTGTQGMPFQQHQPTDVKEDVTPDRSVYPSGEDTVPGIIGKVIPKNERSPYVSSGALWAAVLETELRIHREGQGLITTTRGEVSPGLKCGPTGKDTV